MINPTEHSSQYLRAREMLLQLWPHTWPELREVEESMLTEIMVAFARMESRRIMRELAE